MDQILMFKYPAQLVASAELFLEHILSIDNVSSNVDDLSDKIEAAMYIVNGIAWIQPNAEQVKAFLENKNEGEINKK